MKKVIFEISDQTAEDIKQWIASHMLLTIRSTGLNRCWVVESIKIKIEP